MLQLKKFNFQYVKKVVFQNKNPEIKEFFPGLGTEPPAKTIGMFLRCPII